MVKHTKTIGWQIADKLFECVWLFFCVGTERVKETFVKIWVKCINHVLQPNVWASLLRASFPPFNVGDLKNKKKTAKGGDGTF